MPRLELTAEQRSRLRQAIEEEEEVHAVNCLKLTKILNAEQDAGFSGSLRRAISHSQRSIAELAAAVEIDPRLLDSFRADEVTLPSDVVDRLVNELHLRLVAEAV